MRVLALPAALALALALYLPFPNAPQKFFSALHALYVRMLPIFTYKDGRVDEPLARGALIFLLACIASALGSVHPLLAGLVMAPAFTAAACLPHAVSEKHTLDSGILSRDIPAYEARVREACAALAPAFVEGFCLPLLLAAVGLPVYLGPALVWVLLGARALQPDNRILFMLSRMADVLFSGLLLMCSGMVGRNPARTHGLNAQTRLLSSLGIGEGGTHAPVAGDIAQGVFLCCFCAVLLTLTASLIVFPLCQLFV